MEEITQQTLFDKYPKIFIQSKRSMTETCMCWGLCVNNGWLPIIDELCANIQRNVDERGIKQIEAKQVKVKYADLCFYVNYHDDEIDNLITRAMYKASRICEKCGKTGTVRNDDDWLEVMCDDCWTKILS